MTTSPVTDLAAAIRAELAAEVEDEGDARRMSDAALFAVLELHKPFEELTCSCSKEFENHYVSWPYPCPTLLAIAKALGIEVDGG